MAGDLSTIDFWDVGQGDCSVLHLSDGSVIIIDTGPGSSPVVAWLAKTQPHIHAIVLTHNDADHVSALPSVVHAHAANIDAVYMLDYPHDEPKFRELFDAVLSAQKKAWVHF